MSEREEKKKIQPEPDTEAKLEAIRKATEHSFPTGDIEDMLAEIERGRQG